MKDDTPIYLDDLPITGPCHLPREGLDDSTPEVHCGDCDKPVYNLSQMTRAEAHALLNGEGATPCVSYEADKATGEILFADTDPQRSAPARLRWLVAAAAVAALPLAGMATADGGADALVRSVFSEARAAVATPAPGGGMVAPGQVTPEVEVGEMISSALSSLELYSEGAQRKPVTHPGHEVSETCNGAGEEAEPTPPPVAIDPIPDTVNHAIPAEPKRMFLRGDVAYVPPEPEVAPEPIKAVSANPEPQEGDWVNGRVLKR